MAFASDSTLEPSGDVKMLRVLPLVVNAVVIMILLGVILLVIRKVGRKRLWLMRTIVFCLFAFLAFLLRGLMGDASIVSKQNTLASQLGVDLNTYVWAKSFPASFLSEQINRGDSFERVHEVLNGYYEKAMISEVTTLGGEKLYFEIYFFLSTSEENAQMLKVFYDDRGRVTQIMQSDNNSFRFSTNGYKDGLLIPDESGT